MYEPLSSEGILPVMSKFTFNEQQRSFLFEVFKQGEQTGQKSNPEETNQKMRGHFSSNQYCTVKQSGHCSKDGQVN